MMDSFLFFRQLCNMSQNGCVIRRGEVRKIWKSAIIATMVVFDQKAIGEQEQNWRRSEPKSPPATASECLFPASKGLAGARIPGPA
jgi:hypothetical protein